MLAVEYPGYGICPGGQADVLDNNKQCLNQEDTLDTFEI